MMDAVLTVGLPGLSVGAASSLLEERYVSRVRMLQPKMIGGNVVEKEGCWSVEAKSIQSNLFDSLKSRWQLSLVDIASTDTTTADYTTLQSQQQQNSITKGDSSYSLPSSTTNNTHSCNVRFEVEIQVSNPLISFTLDRVLNDVARKQVEAFEKRCRNVSFDVGGR
jgi:ribosome-associated toxin RatA of RatAB toxin-antitoxin module